MPAPTAKTAEQQQPFWQLVEVLGRRSTAVAVVAALLAAVVGFVFAGTRDPSYQASAATLLDQPAVLAASKDAGVIDKLSRLRLKYAGILRSDAVVTPVAAKLGVSAGTVSGSMVTGSDATSLLLFIGARSSTAKGAVAMANALAEELSAYVSKEQAVLQPRDRLALTVVAPAREGAQLLPTRRQQLVAGVGSGLVVLVLVLVVTDVVRRRRR